MALGLGQIEVKSRIGQPLLAEIPIISNNPAELEQLRAGLASPETFSRIGLQPPRGIVTDLRFAPALDAAGRPIIRVTSAQPVSEPLLTFLVQVDWGQGRLVREYSALVDTPRTVSAPVRPPIEAPVVAGPALVERALPPPTAVIATPRAPATAARVPVPVAAEAPRRDAAIATATPRPPPAPTKAPSPIAASEYGPVKAGESLSQIAGRLDLPGSVSLDHSMIALLRANPGAFIGGNINQLKQGAVLRLPPSSEMAGVDARQAIALVQAQARQWRQSRRAARPPAAVASSGQVAGRAKIAAPTAARAAGARLEIVPPGASLATRAGTQSGISAGGEGQMLRQELQQTKESLAARDAELRELKGRVADLEKLQADQQQLLTMKDSELAAAQQRLAASNQAVATPAAAAATAQAQTAATADAQSPILPWVLGGFGVLVLALFAGWLLRRRSPSRPRFVAPAPMSVESLANVFAPAVAKTPATKTQKSRKSQKASNRASGFAATASSATALGDTEASTPAPVDAAPTLDPPQPPPAPQPAARIDSTPAATLESAALWERRDRQQLPSGRPAPAAAPAWHSGAGTSRTVEVPAAVAVSSASERLELAQAYIDLGDQDSARQLLDEVSTNGDPESRRHASRMLHELG